MKTMQRMAVFILSVLAVAPVRAATVTSKATGDWTAGTTWSTGSQPGSGDTVNVYSNFTVRLSNATNIGTNGTINVGSTTAAQGAGNLAVLNLGVLNVTNVILGNVNSTLSVTNGGQVLSSGSLTIGANAAGQDNNTVVVAGTDGNGNRATWRGTNGFLTIAQQNGVGNGLIVSNGAYAAFGATGKDGKVGSFANASNNYIIVTGADGNGNKATLTYATYIGIGFATGANGNYLIVSNNGVVASGVTLGGWTNSNNYIIIGEGGSYSGQLKLGNHSATFGNYMIVTNGGVATIANGSGIGLGGGVSNYLAVGGTDGGGNKATLKLLQTFDIGAVTNAVSNCLWVGPGGLVTNGTITIGKAAGANGNYIIVTNGAEVSGVNCNVGNVAGACGNYLRIVDGGAVTGGTHVVGAGSGAYGNCIMVTDGGMLSGPNPRMGYNGAVSNYVVVAGTDESGNRSTWNAGTAIYLGGGSGNASGGYGNYIAVSNGGFVTTPSLYVSGNAFASTNDYVLIDSGGVVSNSSAVYLGTITNSLGNYILVRNGGLLQPTRIDAGASTSPYSISNVVRVADGGILQFLSAIPAINIYNTGATDNGVIMDSGSLAYQGIKSGTLPNLTNNTGTTYAGKFTWPNGTTNAFRLNDCYATNSQAGGYTFAYNASDGKQYARLEMVNGTSELRGQSVTIGLGGTLYVDQTVATLRSVVTLAAGATIAVGSTNGLSVTVTGGLTFGNTGTLVLPEGLAKDAEFKLIDSPGGVTGEGNLSSWTDAGGKYKLVRKNTTEVWVAAKPPRGTLIRVF